MTRDWVGFVAAVGVLIPLPLLVLLMFAAALVIGALWYFFPAWVPRRLPRLRGFRLRWPRWRRPVFRWRFDWRFWRRWRREDPADPQLEPGDLADDQLPDVPAETLSSLADRLAAEGRYAEAVRERLRAIVRELIDRQVISHRPGWTVTELARAAAAARPAVDPPLTGAAGLFSDIWYGERPAVADDDERMRALSARVRDALAQRAGAAR